ncbi:hypothetical protein TRFO_36305 [Tritrichomonas foetus]|uniref:Uncharacterized protein n=1 Tax=Tritrichomonas foetus TaxID=1144522 RepID=A0A1J4JIU6_9EUKA|nr:hypothetical protein TRFO_36305 [Tritrichomonas foetus]|eukprot:OHS97483.1 hypothetical protein TRFO_36305 [Tritrichomonas foetus]
MTTTNSKKIILHNNNEYQVNYNRLVSISPKFKDYKITDPIELHDNYSEDAFSVFVDAVNLCEMSIDESICHELTEMLIKWECHSLFEIIENSVLEDQDIDIAFSLFCCSPNSYKNLSFLISQNPRGFADQYPQFYTLPVEVIGSLFYRNDQYHKCAHLQSQPTTNEIREKILSVKKEYEMHENPKSEKARENEKLRNEIEALKQRKKEAESKAARIRNDIAIIERKVPKYKEQSIDKLAQIQHILNNFNSELQQIQALNHSISDIKQQKLEIPKA